ncbi:Fasciclin-domain-containing protein [Canariomyces notabilis]|uniref:Fasciclin-domain-containing protein n=1 Tax=Canariomyces notabilis TaxID=2074819 RepID=A0AAN6TDX3_9PEZI|nr:Fasciclin-domain-containing protein [Canariomyces arenarius]
MFPMSLLFRSPSIAPALLSLTVICAFLPAPSFVGAVDLETVLAGQANLTTFSGLVKNHSAIFANLPDEVTIIAPNDNAFRKLGDWPSFNESTVEATLKYHILTKYLSMTSVVKGDSIWASTTLNDSDFSTVKGGQRLILTKQPGGEVVLTSGFATRGTVVVEDLAFDKGLVQVIDSVMRVPEPLESTARNAYTDLTAFLGALYVSGLMSEVAREEEVTIFAPHNAAFQQLSGVFEGMDAEKLKRILRYHLVPGNVSHIWELKNASSLTTAESGQLLITRHNNYVYVNAAEIIQTDILLSNGLVHMIDNVLNPDLEAALPNLNTTAQPPAFTLMGATATGTSVPTPFTSNLPCTASCPVTSTQPTSAGTATVSGSAASSVGGG